MLNLIRQIWTPREDPPPAVVPEGERVYAMGDIHGRLDLYLALSEAIEADNREREPAYTTVVLLGDLIDRGPQSAGVLTATRIWQEWRNVRVLCGNHEEMFLRSFDDLEIFRHLLIYGGLETLQSYGIDVDGELEDVHAAMCEKVPAADRAMMESFEDYVVIGDYLFVHAGIAPGTPLLAQSVETMRWIREPFLSYPGLHEHVVVHGHTIFDEPRIRLNRIGIDTGAYATGRLTALGLEGGERWIMEAEEQNDGIVVNKRVV